MNSCTHLLQLFLGCSLVGAVASSCHSLERLAPRGMRNDGFTAVDVDVKDLAGKSVDKMVDLGARTNDYGRKTLASHLSQKDLWDEASVAIEKRFETTNRQPRDAEDANLIKLYQLGPMPNAPALFSQGVGSNGPLSIQAAWRLAHVKPSAEMAKAISKRLTKLVAAKGHKATISPAVAKALAINNVKEAYTVLRANLMQTGATEYVAAMADLEPQRSSEDFMAYLAKANASEIESGDFSSVNVTACSAIFAHLMEYPPSLQHPNFEHLFLYSISSNAQLQSGANEVVDRVMVGNEEYVALLLARLPSRMQADYIGQAQGSPSLAKLLDAVQESDSATSEENW